MRRRAKSREIGSRAGMTQTWRPFPLRRRAKSREKSLKQGMTQTGGPRGLRRLERRDGIGGEEAAGDGNGAEAEREAERALNVLKKKNETFASTWVQKL